MTEPFGAAPKSRSFHGGQGDSDAERDGIALRQLVLTPVPARIRVRQAKPPAGGVAMTSVQRATRVRVAASAAASRVPSSVQVLCAPTGADPLPTTRPPAALAARPVLRARTSAAAAKAVVSAAVYPAWRAFWKTSSNEARNCLVEVYQDLLREMVGRFAARLPRSVDRGDLATAANFGLIAAITSFDPARGVRFEAYADRRIRGALLDELRCQDWLPRPWRQRFEQHKRMAEQLRSGLGREPHDHELAERLAIPLDEYQSIFGTGLPGTPAAARAHEDSDETASGIDVVADPRSTSPDDRLSRDELIGLVAQRLTVQEFRIVQLKYWEDLPMRTIGALTGLSESRVCKIHTRLIERLRARLGVNA